MKPEGARKKGKKRGVGKVSGREEWNERGNRGKTGGDMYISYMKTKREAGAPEKELKVEESVSRCVGFVGEVAAT